MTSSTKPSGFDPADHGWTRTDDDTIEKDGYRIRRVRMPARQLIDPAVGWSYHCHAPGCSKSRRFIAASGDLEHACRICEADRLKP